MANDISSGISLLVQACKCWGPQAEEQVVVYRTALSLIEELERQGKLIPGKSKLLEMTSGNTGIGLAFIAAARGYSLTVVMPAGYSEARRAILLALGADVKLTVKEDGPAVWSLWCSCCDIQLPSQTYSHDILPWRPREVTASTPP